MNKENLQKQISEMETKLAEMKKELDKPEGFELWKPEDGQPFYYFSSQGHIINANFGSSVYHGDIVASSNCFKSRIQAERRARYLKVYNKLLALAEQLNVGGESEGLLEECNSRYYFYPIQGRFEIVHGNNCGDVGVVYFKTRETAQTALDSFTEEEKEVLSKGYAG